MAYYNPVSSTNAATSLSSIYGNRNVISGLASGMDTESMIENAVSGIKAKISALQQKSTKTSWKQDAYRSIIDKMVNFSSKYTSYTSNTNLLSASFFNSASKFNSVGKNADKVSAIGRTSSDIKILNVSQLATAATYKTGNIGNVSANTEKPTVAAKDSIDLSETMKLSNVSGSMTIKYGSRSFDIDLGEQDIFESAKDLASAISSKLSEINVTKTDGSIATADTMVGVTVTNDGNISFSDLQNAGNSVYISSATGDIKETLGINTSDKPSVLNTSGKALYNNESTVGKYLNGKEISFTLDGTTKKITLQSDGKDAEGFVKGLQEQLDTAFGKGKITVGNDSKEDGQLKLSFEAGKGSTLAINSKAGSALGLGGNTATSYLNMSQTLGDVLGKDKLNGFGGDNYTKVAAVGEVRQIAATSSSPAYNVDSEGKKVAKNEEDGKWYRIDDKGSFLNEFVMNGVTIGTFSENTALESVLTAINNNSDINVKASYSQTTGQLLFTATETGSAGRISFDNQLAQDLFVANNPTFENQNFAQNFGLTLRDGEKEDLTINFDSFHISPLRVDNTTTMQQFADKLNEQLSGGWSASYDEKTGRLSVTDGYGNEHAQELTFKDSWGFNYKRELEPIPSNFTAGQDAKFSMEVNGVKYDNISRGSNSFDVDGMSLTLKDTFNDEAVTFTAATDSDKIVDAIRSMVNDFNEMAAEIKSAYGTLPAQKTDGSRYDPLTDDQTDGMTETEIKNYEEKAKQGILFGDRDLSNLYERLISAISPSGADGAYLRSIGISTSYSNGTTTMTLDESKLRAALENNPDKVKDAFTKTVDRGSGTDGLMQNLKTQLDRYASTTGDKGILIQTAGSAKAPASLNSNTLQSELNRYDNEISKWMTKLSDKVDYYTRQFTKLEQLIAQMNSQSSALSGLMGGY